MILLYFLFGLSTARAFFFGPTNTPYTHQPMFDNQFWKNFENGMKRLEDSFKVPGTAYHMETDEEAFEDSAIAASNHEPTIGDDSEETGVSTDTGFTDFANVFGLNLQKPWWKGKNVCVLREEVDEGSKANGTEDKMAFGSFQMSTCKQTATKYVCTTKFRNHGIRKTFTVTYECCRGFQKQRNSQQCEEVHLKSLPDTIRDSGSKDFADLLSAKNIKDTLSDKEQNYTIFALADETLGDLRDAIQASNQVDYRTEIATETRRRRDADEEDVQSILLNHVVQGMHDMSEVKSNEVLTTLAGHKLSIGVYGDWDMKPLVTVNCARVTAENKLAENGMVHTVDRVLKPVTKTVAQVIQNEPKLSIFKTMLERADLMKDLENKESKWTVFAPSNSALEALPKETLQAYLSGEECMDQVVRHHLLSSSECLSGLRGVWTVILESGELIKVLRREDGSVRVDQAGVTTEDMVAVNGAVNIIDKVLVPDSARQLEQVLDNKKLTVFKKLLSESGLNLEAAEGLNRTWFVPRDDAFSSTEMKTHLEGISSDKEKIRELIMFHSTQPQLDGSSIENDKLLGSGLPGKDLRLNIYSSGPAFSFSRPRATVNCARMESRQSRVCGGVVRQVDRILLPPTGDILNHIQNNPQFSILNKIVKTAEMEEVLKESGPMTLLAPTDDAFNRLPAGFLNSLLDTKEKAKKIISQHILPESLCCSGVSSNAWPWTHQVVVREGNKLQPRRDSSGNVHFSSAAVKTCDQVATNGIVHTVSKVIVPQEKQAGLFPFFETGGLSHYNPNVQLMLFGI